MMESETFVCTPFTPNQRKRTYSMAVNSSSSSCGSPDHKQLIMDSSREWLENYLSSMTQTGRVVTSTPKNGSKPNEENPQEFSEWTPVGNQRKRSY